MTINTANKLDDDPLAQRLEALEAPPAVFRREAATSTRPRVFRAAELHRRRITFVAVLAATLVVVLTAAAFPQIGPDILRWAGLTQNQVQPLQGSASRGLARITVAGGYADSIDTVLFAEFENATCQMGPYLTDQFGEKYRPVGGWGLNVGVFPVIFEPLRGQARHGATLTLHCELGPNGADDLAVNLSGTLTESAAKTLAAPAAITKDGTTYEVVSLRWSGTYLEVHTKISGRKIDDLVAHESTCTTSPPPSGECGVTFPGIFVSDRSGQDLIPVAVLNEQAVFPTLERDHVLDETRVFTVSAAGTYTIKAMTEPNSTPLVSWTISVG